MKKQRQPRQLKNECSSRCDRPRELLKRWRSTWSQGASSVPRMPSLQHVCQSVARPRQLPLLWPSRRRTILMIRVPASARNQFSSSSCQTKRSRSHFVHIASYTHLGRALLVLNAELHPGCRAARIRPSGPRVVGGGRSRGRVRTWLARHGRLTAIRMLPGQHTL